MELPILYKRAKTGKIVSYEIYTSPKMGGTTITKITGQLEGKKIIHTTLVTKGKQGRTMQEQAEFMAKSDWKKKQDEGYKSFEDLGIKHPGQDHVYEVDSEGYGTLQAVLENTLPKNNTDASGNIKPMLAHEAKKHMKKVKYSCYVQPKLDGVRCLAIVGQNDTDIDETFSTKSVELLSRSGKPYNVPHIQEALLNLPPGIYDGEIYTNKLTFQDLVSAVKANKGTSKLLEYHIYDIITEGTQSQRFLELNDLNLEKPLVLVETYSVDNENTIKEMHDAWVSQGYEGLMIRSTTGLYEHSRSYNLLKYKQFDDAEFELVRWVTGEREEDLIATCQMSDGRKFNAKMMGSKEQKEAMRAEPFFGRKYITIKHFGFTDDGIPRFPIGKSIRD